MIQRRREVYGEMLGLVGGTSTAWGATLPIVGKGYIERILLMAQGDSVSASAVVWRPWWVGAIPTTNAELWRGEALFPYAQREGNDRGNVYSGSGGPPLVLEGPFWYEPEGRRLGLSVTNMGSANLVCGVTIFWRPSDAEQSNERLRRVGDA